MSAVLSLTYMLFTSPRRSSRHVSIHEKAHSLDETTVESRPQASVGRRESNARRPFAIIELDDWSHGMPVEDVQHSPDS